MPSSGALATGGTVGGGRLKVRPLKLGDLDAVVAIDRAVSGRLRRAFYEKRFQQYARDPNVFITLAAEYDGRFVGFALVRLYEGEFGTATREASLDAIGVNAEMRHRGVGRGLIDGLVATLRIQGIRELATQVEWTETELLGFFARTKFTLAPRVVLERPISGLETD